MAPPGPLPPCGDIPDSLLLFTTQRSPFFSRVYCICIPAEESVEPLGRKETTASASF